MKLEKAMQSHWQAPRLLLLLGSFASGILSTLVFIGENLRAGVSVLAITETKGARRAAHLSKFSA